MNEPGCQRNSRRRSGLHRLALHGAIVVAVAVGYLLLRIVLAPTTGPLRWHATDLLAGIALPSLFALLLPQTMELGRWARTLSGKLALTGSATVVWEVVVPLLSDRSTPDIVDVIAYLVGTTIQHAIVRETSARARAPA